MKALTSLCGALMITSLLLAGCSQETKSTDKKVMTTPSGSTTVTTEQKVDKTGDHRTDTKPANNP